MRRVPLWLPSLIGLLLLLLLTACGNESNSSSSSSPDVSNIGGRSLQPYNGPGAGSDPTGGELTVSAGHVWEFWGVYCPHLGGNCTAKKVTDRVRKWIDSFMLPKEVKSCPRFWQIGMIVYDLLDCVSGKDILVGPGSALPTPSNTTPPAGVGYFPINYSIAV